jgi:hypothetical protein
MKICFRCLLFLFLIGAGLVLWTGPVNGAEGGKGKGLRIGAAEIDITPPVGHRMAGYFDERLAGGVHDPLKAKAIVIDQDGTQIAMVFCDLVGISLNVTTNARAEASQKTGIPYGNIVIGATHSHTGPLFDDVRRHYFHEAALAKYGKDPREKIYYPALLTNRLVKVIAKAQANLRPAELDAGIGKEEHLSFNRRFWMRDGKVRFNPGILNTNIVRPAGPIDPDVGILLARELRTGRLFAGLTVFAMHCDTVGGTNYSADYPFYLQETLRAGFGKQFISAFGAGTCGDINHIDVSRNAPFKGPGMAEHLGTTLGKDVLDAHWDLKEMRKLSLATRSLTLDVPLRDLTPEAMADAKSKISKIGDPQTDFMAKVVAVRDLDLARRGPTCPMEVQVFRFSSDTAVVCLPCEIFVELGLAIKKASPFKNTIVISICNDRPSYVPTKKAFSEGSYEITNARVKSGAGEMLVDAAVKLLNEVSQ